MKSQNDVPLREYVERRFDGFEKSIDDLKTNHFNHLGLKVEKIEAKMDRNMWLLVTTLAAIIVHAIGVIIH